MILQSRNVLNVQLLQLLKLHFPTLQNSNSVVALKILATEQPFFAFGLASFRAVHGGSSSLSSTFPGSGRTGKCSYKSQYALFSKFIVNMSMTTSVYLTKCIPFCLRFCCRFVLLLSQVIELSSSLFQLLHATTMRLCAMQMVGKCQGRKIIFN